MIRRTFLVLLSALALGACGGSDDPAGLGQGAAGVYTLRTVNGLPLPAVIYQDATGKVEIVADAVTLNANGTWSESGTVRATLTTGAVSTQPNTDSGTYTLNGTALVLTSLQSGATTAALSGNAFTITDVGLVLVYQK
jgi:hypothetical protein